MERQQKARCSGRGRVPHGGQQRSSLSPRSPGVRMQLRDPSVRRPSRNRTDAFEWPQLSPSSKGNARRNSVTKRLVVQLERIPVTAYSEPPMLQHYMQEDASDGVDLETEDEKSSCALPPNLLPEVIVTRGKKRRRLQNDFAPSIGKSVVSPPMKRRRTLSKASTSSSLENLSENDCKKNGVHISPVVSGNQSRQNCMKLPSLSTERISLSEESDFDSEIDFSPESKDSITQEFLKMSVNLESHHNSNVSQPPLHLPPHPLADISEKRVEKKPDSPTLPKEADDDCNSVSVAESTSAWSDGLDELFQEPERISTGKEQVDTIDGVDFLSFETKADMLEFTAIEMDHIRAPPSPTSEDQSPTIVPTKTNDITKIKGWRTKHFASNTNYSGDFENFAPHYGNIGMRRRSSITYGSLSQFSKGHSVTDQGPLMSEEEDEHQLHHSKQFQENRFIPTSPKVIKRQGKIIKPVKLMSPKALKMTKNDESIEAPSNLDQTWVEFAVSAVVNRTPAEIVKLRRKQATSKDRISKELQEKPTPQPENVKKAVRFPGPHSLLHRPKLGRPIMYPLSPYMRKKLKVYREVYKKSPKQIKFLPESKRRVSQCIKQTINSLVSAVEMKLHHGKIVATSETGKEKTNRELRKLGHVVIDMEEKPRQESRSQFLNENCEEEFCKLGCVCQSLETIPQPQGHCGKVDCMFECSCTEPVPTLAVERLIEDDKRDLAPAEKEFRNTVIRADDGIMVVKQRGRREIKMPGRFRDDMLTGEALLAVDHKYLRVRGPGKSKLLKESENESLTNDQKPRLRKSLLNSKGHDQPNSQAKKLFEADVPQRLDQYFNVPSPEMLFDPNTPEAAVSESTPLYNQEGGFISRAMEEQFLASQVRVKQEKPYVYEEDGAIEIDDMGWQSLDADMDLPETSDGEDDEPQEFGKIISVTSLAPEEFEKDYAAPGDIVPESSSALDVFLTEHSNPSSRMSDGPLDVNIDSGNALDTDSTVPKARQSSKKEGKKPNNSNLEKASTSSDILSPVKSGEKKSKGQQVDPSHQRMAAKLRAKRLAEFFTMNSVVSTLVKSAYEFKPSVLQRDAITLLQWSTLKLRFNERSMQLWIKDSQGDFHFLVTDTEEQPLPGYSNLWNHKIQESSSVPEVARQLQQTFTSVVDYQRCCILWCNGLHWEFIGTLLKNSNGKAAPVTLPPSCKPKTLASWIDLPTDSIQSKWYAVLLNNDFEALELKNENLQISYSKLNQVIGAAWRYKKTVYIELTKNSAHAHEAPFGLYAKPNEYRQVYIGPYRAKEHALLELVPYQGVICKSKIISCIYEEDASAEMPDTQHLNASRSRISKLASNFTQQDCVNYLEPEHYKILGDKKCNENTPSSMIQQMQSKINVEQPDVPPSRQPLVTSSGRTRKIPKHLLDDMVIESIPDTSSRKSKKSQDSAVIESSPTKLSIRGRPRKAPQVDTITPEKQPVVKRGRPKKHIKSEQIEVTPLLFDEDIDEETLELQVNDSGPTSTRDESESEESSEKSDCETEEQEQPRTASSQDDNEQLESDPANEGDEENSEQSPRKKKKHSVVKTGTLTKLVCSAAGVPPLLVVVYVSGSLRFRNPFGIRIVHFENLELAQRFLNFIYRTIVPGATLTWTPSMWTDLSKESISQFAKLQNSRVRITTCKELDLAIGRDGSTRPVRHKRKPHQRKPQRKNSVQKIIEECEINGVFAEVPGTDINQTAFVPAYLKKFQKKSNDKKTSAIPKPLPQDLLDCSSVSTVCEEEDWFEEEVESGGSGPLRMGEKLQLHRDMEKVRRRELAQRFRSLACMLVPPDMLERCSKIMVLQKAMQEIAKIIKTDKKWKQERVRLEARREELFKSFSRSIADMEQSKRTAAIVELRALLNSGKCCSRSTSTSYTKASDTHMFEPMETEAAVMQTQTIPPKRSPVKKKLPKLPKPPKSPTKPMRPKGVKIVPPRMMKLQQPMMTPGPLTVEAPNFEEESASGSVTASTSGKTSMSPEPEGGDQPWQQNVSPQMLPLHKLSYSVNAESVLESPTLVNTTPPACRKSDLPCHVRISKDGKIYLPMKTPSVSSNSSVLLSRRMVITRPHLEQKLFPYKKVQPQFVDLSDEGNQELPPTVKKRSHIMNSFVRVSPYNTVINNDKTVTKDRDETEPFDSSKVEVTVTKVRRKPVKKLKTNTTKNVSPKFFNLLNSSEQNSNTTCMSGRSTTITHNNREAELESDIVIFPTSSYGGQTTQSGVKNVKSTTLQIFPKDVGVRPILKPVLQPKLIPSSCSLISAPLSEVSSPLSSLSSEPLVSELISQPSVTISIASNPLIPQPVNKVSRVSQPSAPHPVTSQPSAPRPVTSQPSAPRPLTSQPVGKGQNVIIPAKHPVVMMPNGNRIILMPGGMAKVTMATPQMQQSDLQKPDAADFQVPRFVIDREVMRARLNAVKPIPCDTHLSTAVLSENCSSESSANVPVRSCSVSVTKEVASPTLMKITSSEKDLSLTVTTPIVNVPIQNLPSTNLPTLPSLTVTSTTPASHAASGIPETDQLSVGTIEPTK